MSKQKTATRPIRLDAIDVLRGIAIAMMIVFHFSFDLTMFNLSQQNFYDDPFWLNFRVVIVSTFLSVMGASLYIAHHRHIIAQKFFKRLLLLLAAAIAVSIASYIMNKNRFIYFGILHFIALASIIGLVFIRFYWLNLLLGIAVIVLDRLVQAEFFNAIQWQWIGLMTVKPLTDDYVPLIPWFGVVLLGMFFARWGILEKNIAFMSDWRATHPLARLLGFAGKHSLLIYLLHQPLFIGILYTVTALF